MRQMTPNDPAPSRLAYRLQRLTLGWRFWAFLRYGVPVLLIGAVAFAGFGTQARRDVAFGYYLQLRDAIAMQPAFMVEHLEINGASGSLGEDLREVLSLDLPISSFDLNATEIRATVMELDPVANVNVQLGGGILRLDVVERIPAYVWRNETGLDVLDATGALVHPLSARSDAPNLPLLVGSDVQDNVPQARAILDALTPIKGRLRALMRVGARRWDVILDRGQIIALPEQDAVPALLRVLALHEAEKLLDRDIQMVDMRLPRRPIMRLSDGALQDLLQARLDAQQKAPE